jgi:hypothetical protein
MVVEGPDEDVKAFIDQHMDDECFDYETVSKMPEELVGTRSPEPQTLEDASRDPFIGSDATEEEVEKARQKVIDQFNKKHEYVKKFGASNWYDWTGIHWGTKWGAYDASVIFNEKGYLKCRYNTAWGMGTPVNQKVSEMHPTLTFTFHVLEEGGFFAGTIIYEKGEVVEETDENADKDRAKFGTTHEACTECGCMYNVEWCENEKGLCYECEEALEEEEA